MSHVLHTLNRLLAWLGATYALIVGWPIAVVYVLVAKLCGREIDLRRELYARSAWATTLAVLLIGFTLASVFVLQPPP